MYTLECLSRYDVATARDMLICLAAALQRLSKVRTPICVHFMRLHRCGSELPNSLRYRLEGLVSGENISHLCAAAQRSGL